MLHIVVKKKKKKKEIWKASMISCFQQILKQIILNRQLKKGKHMEMFQFYQSVCTLLSFARWVLAKGTPENDRVVVYATNRLKEVIERTKCASIVRAMRYNDFANTSVGIIYYNSIIFDRCVIIMAP